jgi:hypothetical protein
MKSEIDIEETQRLAPYGVICLNENGRKLYFKPRKLSRLESMKESAKNSILEYELVPVTSKELKELGIEESAHQQGEEFEIEESASEPTEEEKKKKANLTLSGDPNAVHAARNILEKEMAKQKGEPTKEELLDENEQLKSSLELIAEKQATKRCDELGIKDNDMRIEFIAHPDKLKAYEDGLKGKGQSASAGTAPLNSAQWGENGQPPTYDVHGDLMNKKYPSYEAMLEDLHDREAVFQGSPKGVEATRMLEALTRKFFEAHKETNSPVPVLQKPMPKLVLVNGLLTPEDPSMGDLQERNRIFRRRKLMEREERGSVAVKGEDK